MPTLSSPFLGKAGNSPASSTEKLQFSSICGLVRKNTGTPTAGRETAPGGVECISVAVYCPLGLFMKQAIPPQPPLSSVTLKAEEELPPEPPPRGLHRAAAAGRLCDVARQVGDDAVQEFL